MEHPARSLIHASLNWLWVPVSNISQCRWLPWNSTSFITCWAISPSPWVHRHI